jgi:hypothetical protein
VDEEHVVHVRLEEMVWKAKKIPEEGVERSRVLLSTRSSQLFFFLIVDVVQILYKVQVTALCVLSSIPARKVLSIVAGVESIGCNW